MTLKLNIVTCSTRPGRIGPSITTWFREFAANNSGFDCELVDPSAIAMLAELEKWATALKTMR